MLTQHSAPPVVCKLLEEAEFPAWDRFVASHPQASVYHLSPWRRVLSEAFGKRLYVIAAMQGDTMHAGLPLVHMHSRLFGQFLVSMPYVNYGGLLTEDDSCTETILQQAIALGQQLKAEYLELRHLENHYPHLPTRQDKVSMWLALPNTVEELLASFKAKLRSQICKGEKNNLQVKIGSTEWLDDFYTVFSHNMRDLGTPVYGRVFFRSILDAYPERARIVVVTDAGQRPIASGFLLGYRDRLEIPWASSLRAFNHLQSNMWLYWNCLRYACEQGYRTFDFGRSTVGTSTYKFKEQWGARPVQHYWHYYLAAGKEMPHLSPQNPKFRLVVNVWRRLPVSVARVLGPVLVKHLP